MISSALQIGQTQQQIRQKRLTDVVDTVYKKALIENMGMTAATAKLKAETALAKSLRKSPLEVPGRGLVTLDEWRTLDTKTKAYSYYAFDAQRRDEEVISYNEWSKQTDTPTAFDLYKLAEDDPEFNEWLTKYRRAGAISIGQTVERARALADVKAEKYLTDPKGLSKDINKYKNSNVFRDIMLQIDDPVEGQRKSEELIIDFVDDKIKVTGGKILKSGYDGDDLVWIVKTKTGETVEIRRPR